MSPAFSGWPTWFPLLAHFEHFPAPGDHRLMACRPSGSMLGGAEEGGKSTGLGRMMHADDPLTPGQILYRVPGMDPFPVHDRGDLLGLGIEQDVVGTVITVHQHRA